MNMNYCRFRNTLEDLHECYDNMDDHDLDEGEQEARVELIKLCMEIASWYAEKVEELGAAPAPAGGDRA